MKIGSISEDLNSEKRISLTPELSKKYLDLGLEIFINKGYGTHLGFHDSDYNEKGVQILNNIEEVIDHSNRNIIHFQGNMNHFPGRYESFPWEY